MTYNITFTRLALLCPLLIVLTSVSYGGIGADTLAPSFQIPAISGPLTIDGKIEEPGWQQAAGIPFENPEFEFIGTGGRFSIAVRGNYLCLSAHIPEKQRPVVHSAGATAKMWREDMVVWKIYFASPVTRRNTAISFAVNAAGAYSLLEAENYYTSGRNEMFNTRDSVANWSGDVLASAAIGSDSWNVEAALPLKQLGVIGFISAERYRAMRPDAPEAHWYWPEKHNTVKYELSNGNGEPTPMRVDEISMYKEEKRGISFAKAISDLPKKVWNDEQAKAMQVDKMFENYVSLRMNNYAEQEKQEWKKIKTVGGWESFRDKRINALKKWLGPMPQRTPLHATVTNKRNYGDGFVIENIVFESRPGIVVTANLYLPEQHSKKMPAIVIVHSHHFPKTQIELQEMGMNWARAGAAVLVMDQLCAGERIQTQPWHREGYYGRYNLGNQMYLAGESLIKWMAWDIMRSIDLLSEREYIDTTKIALVGAVAGGGDPAAITAILDPRITAVIPFNFGKSGSDSTLSADKLADLPADPGLADWETSRSIPYSVSKQFFPWMLCASVAPRYLVYASESKWKYTAEEEIAWQRYKRVFGWYNAKDHLAEVQGYTSFPGPGECNNVGLLHRKQIDPLLHRWLGISNIDDEIRRQISESDLDCLTPAMYKQYKPKLASAVILDSVKQHLSEARSKMSSLSEEQRRQWLLTELAARLGDIMPGQRLPAKLLWSKPHDTFTMEAWSLVVEKGMELPLFILTPKTTTARMPAVIAIAEGGKELFLTKRSNEIETLLKKGVVVCLPDVRANGELNSETLRGPNQMEMSANEFILGNTLMGSRLKDVRTIFRWMANRSGIDTRKLSLWGDSFSETNPDNFLFDQSFAQKPGPFVQHQAEPLGPFLALLTALYEDRVSAVATNGMLISFQSVLEDRFCHIPQDIIVPGMLTVGDVPDIVSAIAPRKIFSGKVVDGRNIAIADKSEGNYFQSFLNNLVNPYSK
jgi:dienelactone hydrolase